MKRCNSGGHIMRNRFCLNMSMNDGLAARPQAG
jgi:hypothetical protein